MKIQFSMWPSVDHFGLGWSLRGGANCVWRIILGKKRYFNHDPLLLLWSLRILMIRIQLDVPLNQRLWMETLFLLYMENIGLDYLPYILFNRLLYGCTTSTFTSTRLDWLYLSSENICKYCEGALGLLDARSRLCCMKSSFLLIFSSSPLHW